MAETHVLKTVQPWFDQVWRGTKTFEVRLNDRGFVPGDRVELREYDAATGTFGQREVHANIGSLYDLGLNGLAESVVFTLMDPRFIPRAARIGGQP